MSFDEATQAFDDPHRIIEFDSTHSDKEERYHCYEQVNGNILTVRFTLRDGKICIFGAAYWSKGRKIYEKKWQH